MTGWMNRKGRPWGRKFSWVRGRRERSQSQGGRESFYIKDQVEKGEEGGRGSTRTQEEMPERWEVNQERVLQVPREEDNSGRRE